MNFDHSPLTLSPGPQSGFLFRTLCPIRLGTTAFCTDSLTFA